jgi:2-C-methyl-D-erythritol 4-phosphate cytidylyltransferase
VWAIVVAGGSGHRFGGPKQFLQLAGRPVAAWAVSAARTAADGVVLVVPDPSGDAHRPVDDAESQAPVDGGAEGGADNGPRGWGADCVVTGGPSRADSVRAGLAAVPDDATIIVVHDAARPLASPALFAAVVGAVRDGDAEGAIPVLAVSDTLKRTSGDLVGSTVDRDGLVTVQTPQAFAAATLRAAHRSGGQTTDDAGLLEQLGAPVRTVPGDPWNLKLTRPEDLDIAEALRGTVTW